MYIALRYDTEQTSIVTPRGVVDAAMQKRQKSEQWYICRGCHHKITRPDEYRTIQGSHLHTFANPGGIVYEFFCFTKADGCILIGPDSSEFTWFVGYCWRIAVCGSCRIHLGWKFTSGFSQSFFGLISERLALVSLSRA